MIEKLINLIKNFCPVANDQFLNLPKIKFKQNEFAKFLSDNYKIVKTPQIVFGSSPFRWILGSFKFLKDKVFLYWPGIITQAFLQKTPDIKFQFALVLAHETKHLIETQNVVGKAWLTIQYLFYYSCIFIASIHLISNGFSFFPLNLLFWLVSFFVYYILPSEIFARKFAKQQLTKNQNQWQDFFEIS